MASSDSEKQSKDQAAKREDEPSTQEVPAGSGDDEGLSPEQEDTLNKIMAEIEANDSSADAEAPPNVDSADDGPAEDAAAAPDGDADLDPEQMESLEKIMAEIADQESANADSKAAAATSAEASDEADGSGDAEGGGEGLSPEQEDALSKIMAEIESKEAADGEDESEAAPGEGDSATGVDATVASDEAASAEGLDREQEDALNKIMAEIETRDDDTSAAASDASDASSEAVPSSAESVGSETIDGPEGKSGLSPDQEDALNKIMAEIESKDQTPPSDQDNLTSEQEDALNKIMAEIEGQDDAATERLSNTDTDEAVAGEGVDAIDSGASVGPDAAGAGDTPTADAEQATADADPAVADADQATAGAAESDAASPSDETDASQGSLDHAAPPVSASPPPSTEDLLSQIQAAAQGSEEELNVQPAAKDTATAASPTTDAPAPSDTPPPPLAEVEAPEAAAQKNRPQSQRPRREGKLSEKIRKTAALAGVTAAVVLMVAAGTYYWLSRGEVEPVNGTTTLVATAAEEPSRPPTAETAQVADELLESAAPLQASPPPLAVHPGSERLQALVERIKAQREEMRAKIREIDDLSAYYLEGMEKITAELIGHIQEKEISDYASARQDTAISMGLETIHRRAGYIDKLKHPRHQIHLAAEELHYLARKADILRRIIAKSSGGNLDPFAKQVEESMARLSNDVAQLSMAAEDNGAPSLEETWRDVWSAHMKAPKKEPPATVALLRNREIWSEICSGNFNRTGHLTALASDAAACLAAWEGKDLFLNNLKRLTPEAARNLAAWKGEWLVLNGLKTLSPEAARQLAAWRGKRLSLNGIEALSPATTQALATWQGHQLELIGLQQLAAWDNPQTTLYVRSEVRDNLAR